MQNERKKLEEEVQATKAALSEKLSVIENEVRETMENIKETREQVKEKIDAVQRAFAFKRQMNEHPIEMVGGAVAGGLILGALVGRKGSPRSGSSMPYRSDETTGYSTLNTLKELFSDEWNMVKGLIVGNVVHRMEDLVKNKVPQYATPINEVLHSAASKLGARSMPAPEPKTTTTTATTSPAYPIGEKKQWRPG